MGQTVGFAASSWLVRQVASSRKIVPSTPSQVIFSSPESPILWLTIKPYNFKQVKENSMSKRFTQVKEQLLKERQKLLQEVSNSYEACREIGQDGVPDIGDMSSAAYSRDVLFNVSETQRQKINDIDVALEQIEKGEYGVCMSCGEDISPRRMEVRPFSRYCIECKTDIEKLGK